MRDWVKQRVKLKEVSSRTKLSAKPIELGRLGLYRSHFNIAAVEANLRPPFIAIQNVAS